jgi:hypothetical protein
MTEVPVTIRLRIALLVFLPLVTCSIASPSHAGRRLSVDLGYVSTSSSDYSSGLFYGATITEGTGRIGFAVSAHRFSNTITYQTSVKAGQDIRVYKYEEAFSDLCVTVMATLRFRDGQSTNQMFVGLGPQVHLIAARKFYAFEGIEEAAHDGRVGFGGMLRYQRQIRMFGKTALVVTGSYSWMRSVAPVPGIYAPPPESMTFGAITAGLAFAF